MWRFAGCRSPIAAIGRGRSRSRVMRRLCSRVRRTISRTPPSRSCSSRPSTTRRARDSSSAGVRGRRRRRTPGPSTCSPSTAGSAAPSNGRPTARDSWGVDDRRQVLSPSTAARCPERPARCWIRWRPCASEYGWRPARSCASRSRPVSPTIERRLSRWCGSTAMRAPRLARSRWPRRTRTSRCSTWA